MKVLTPTSEIYNLGYRGCSLGYKLFITCPSELAKKARTAAITDCGNLLAKLYDEDPQTNVGMHRLTYVRAMLDAASTTFTQEKYDPSQSLFSWFFGTYFVALHCFYVVSTLFLRCFHLSLCL